MINVQYKRIISCPNNETIEQIQEFIRNVYNEIDELEEEKNIIKQKILMLEMKDWNLISLSSEIDLYKVDDSIDGTYFIYLHNSSEEVGFITYDPKYSSSRYGDISYTIYDEYQGNSYAFKALCMLSQYLTENDVELIRISSKRNNVSSIKTIEKYERINSCKKNIDFEHNLLICDFDLNTKKHIKKLTFNN